MGDVQAQIGMFTAAQVEARTGVSAGTLRQWERRYGFPAPQRNGSGYRLYSPQDLDRIQVMQAHLRSGVPAGRAAQLTALGVSPVAEPLPASPQPVSTQDLARALTTTLVRADLPGAEAALAQAHALLPVEAVLSGVIATTLVEIGQRWERGEITVAHEHQASAFLRARLSALMDLAGAPDALGPLVVAACAPGEEHELGLMMVGILLRRRGVRVAYLGPNVPLADVALYARQVGAQALLLALNGDWALPGMLAQKRDLAGLDLPVLMGGALLTARPELAAELGGHYAGPDLKGAVHAALSVLGTGPGAGGAA